MGTCKATARDAMPTALVFNHTNLMAIILKPAVSPTCRTMAGGIQCKPGTRMPGCLRRI